MRALGGHQAFPGSLCTPAILPVPAVRPTVAIRPSLPLHRARSSLHVVGVCIKRIGTEQSMNRPGGKPSRDRGRPASKGARDAPSQKR